MTIRPLPVLLAALGLAVAGQAGAQNYLNAPAPSEGPDIVVTAPPYSDAQVRAEGVGFRDLDLSTHAGAYTLLRRIRGAAQRVCSPAPTYPDQLQDYSNYQHCFRWAVRRAVADVDAPTLQDVYYGVDPQPTIPGG